MGFATTYLEKRALFPELIQEAPDKFTGIIVVVPAFDEPDIEKLLDSLSGCYEPPCKVEVIIVVNAPANADRQSLENNLATIRNIESWKKENRNCFFRLFLFDAGVRLIKEWGVGLARKTGMDEAVRRFDRLNYADGIILSLDADCLVEKNYFVSVFDDLIKKRDCSACSIYFEHPLSGNDFPEYIYKNITLYELHLRYYFQGLAYSGFPYVFHTIGSAFAVSAKQYVRTGGMNKRQAAEDFYFIQKLVQSGGYFNLNSTTIYPSPRASKRVPFGTGASIEKLSESKQSTLLTYNMLAFKELRSFFNTTDKIFYCKPDDLYDCYNLLPEGIRSFLTEKEYIEKVNEIKNNTSGLLSFKKRFYGWFNMFRIVKYLNYVHKGIFKKKPVDVSALELLENTGIIFRSKEPSELLHHFRQMEKNPTCFFS